METSSQFDRNSMTARGTSRGHIARHVVRVSGTAPNELQKIDCAYGGLKQKPTQQAGRQTAHKQNSNEERSTDNNIDHKRTNKQTRSPKTATQHEQQLHEQQTPICRETHTGRRHQNYYKARIKENAINPSINQWIDRFIDESINRTIIQSIDRWISQLTNQPIDQLSSTSVLHTYVRILTECRWMICTECWRQFLTRDRECIMQKPNTNKRLFIASGRRDSQRASQQMYTYASWLEETQCIEERMEYSWFWRQKELVGCDH